MKKLFKLGATLVLVALVIWYAGGINEIVDSFTGIDSTWIFVAVAVMTLDRLLMSFKWGLLLRSHAQELSLFKNFQIYCASAVYGLLLPATVGADVIRTAMVRTLGLDFHVTVASIVTERMVGFILALIVGLLGVILLRSQGYIPDMVDEVFVIGAFLLAVFTAIFLFSMTDAGYRLATGWLPGRIKTGNLEGLLRKIHEVYSSYRRKPKLILVFVSLTLLEILLSISFTWVLANAIGLQVDIVFIAGIVPLAVLVTRLPITVDGLGTGEATLIGLFSLAGVGAAHAVALSVLIRVVQIGANLPWWCWYSVTEGSIFRSFVRPRDAA